MTTPAPVKIKPAAREPMMQRNLRVPVGLWDAAAAKGGAETPSRGISDVVRDLLREYVGE